MRQAALFTACAAWALVHAPARTAGAYCFSAACGDEGKGTICDGDGLPEGGCYPLAWRTGCVGFSVQGGGSSQVSADATEVVAELAFEAWAQADCGDGRSPGIYAQNLGQVECGAVEYNKDAANANVIVYRDDGWPNPDTGHNIALTTTTYDPDTGELLDADIELNSANYPLTVNDESTEFDLYSVLVHEIGHFFGLGHSETLEATMYASYDPGTTTLRTLEPDDVAAICALYPPDARLGETCNPLPRHGFSPYCGGEQPEGDCALRGPPAPGTWGLVALGAAALAALARRRQPRAMP